MPNGPDEVADLMRDEFRRIKALAPQGESVAREIMDLCDRAISDIDQHFPVIVQRDDAERELTRVAAQLYDARMTIILLKGENDRLREFVHPENLRRIEVARMALDGPTSLN